MGQLVRRVGVRFAAAGLAYQTAEQPLACTLLGCWEAGHDEPWALRTDLPASSASPLWYGFRAWVEQQFKTIEGGLWHWQNTRMTDPDRVERMWRVVAVAVLWLVALGAAVESDQRQETVGKSVGRRRVGRRVVCTGCWWWGWPRGWWRWPRVVRSACRARRSRRSVGRSRGMMFPPCPKTNSTQG